MAETSDSETLMSSRYGRRQMASATRRRVTIALTVLAVVAGVAVAVLGYRRFEGDPVEGEMAAYEVLDNKTVSVTISVTRKDPTAPVVCIVRARSKDGAETGRREILVGPAQTPTVQVTATVTTYKPSFMGDIYGCGTNVPGYLLAR
jgi:hypothetical protein